MIFKFRLHPHKKNIYAGMLSLIAILFTGLSIFSPQAGIAGESQFLESRRSMSPALRERALLKKNDIAASECYQYEVNLKGERKNCYKISEQFYDENGNTTVSMSFDKNSNTISKEIYRYDSNENKISKKVFNRSGDITSKWIYKYDRAGNILEMTLFDSDNDMCGRWKFNYASEGKLNGLIEYNCDGEVFNKSVIINSKDISREINYSNEGNIVNKRTTFFNEKGLKKSIILYDNHNEINLRTFYKYDSNENLEQNAAYGFNGEIFFKFINRYNEENMLAEKTVYSRDNRPEKIEIYVYKKRQKK